MNKAMQAVANYFKKNDWNFELDEEHGVLQTGMQGENAKFKCYAIVEDSILQFLTVFPSNVSEKKRSEIAEFITRACYNLKVGRLEMDYNDGEVRFHTSSLFAGEVPAEEVIHGVVGYNLVQADKHYPAMMSITFGGAKPAEVVEKFRLG